MARVEVVDPSSGVTLDVDEGSVQAKIWGGSKPVVGAEAVPETVEAEPIAEPVVETPKRKPGRPKK